MCDANSMPFFFGGGGGGGRVRDIGVAFKWKEALLSRITFFVNTFLSQPKTNPLKRC